ncbi:MAG: PSD1 and planctomycete cytochrome C domain-containing protein [Opitutaceae bacterium]
MTTTRSFLAWMIPAAILLAGSASARGAPAAEERGLALFKDSIEPLLREHCYKCHSHESEKIKGELVLDSRSGWAEGGASGPAIMPGKPDESLLYRAVSYADEDLQMPPKGKKLPAAEIEKFRRWIALGAPDPRERKLPTPEEKLAQAREHWAYRPITRMVAPAAKNGSPDSRQPIDAFVEAWLEAEGIRAAGPADSYTLLRRVTFDLTGLPPAPEEIAAFIDDARPDAYARVVERLLGSPAFGEHWARHWLDLACYGDMVDSARMPVRDAWRYRDYIVESFNRDKPLDRFIAEQLAGDLLPTANDAQRREQLIALGFLAIGPWSLAEQVKEQLRMDVVDHQITRVGRVFLGMTLDCARCHNHKFDPVTLNDYYGLAGIFGSTETIAGLWRGNLSLPVVAPLPETAEEKALREAATEPYARELAEATRKLAWLQEEYALAAKELAACEEGKCEAHEAVVVAANKKLEDQDKVVQLLDFHRPRPPEAAAVRDRPQPADCRINVAGSVSNLGAAVPRGFIAVLDATRPPLPAGQSGRLELAQWLTAADQPLTARVLANRIWHHVFGAGLVRSVDYFGERGERPTHPELLDYLALRLRDRGWGLKSLIREMVLSQTYQRASSHDELAAQRDPENRLLWRANRRRLDAEMIRDAWLAASGALSRERGGEAMPLRVEGNLAAGDVANPPTVSANLKLSPAQLARRTLYLPVYHRTQPQYADLLNLFDFPLPVESTGARRTTAVPTQSLYLLNAPFLKEQAKLLATRLLAETGDEVRRIERLWLLVCGQPPTAAEREAVNASLQAWLGEEPTAARRKEAWSRVCHSVLSSNAFLFRL